MNAVNRTTSKRVCPVAQNYALTPTPRCLTEAAARVRLPPVATKARGWGRARAARGNAH